MSEQTGSSGKIVRNLLLIILAIIVLVLLIAGIAGGGYVLRKISRIQAREKVDPQEEVFDRDTDAEDDEVDDWGEIAPLMDDKLLNILLIGEDRGEVDSKTSRSDVMLLCSINPDTKKASMVSFMRDLYVQIPGYSDNRLNSAYSWGGSYLLKETLMKNFGVSVDCCFVVNFDGFSTGIDIIGGVDIELSDKEVEALGIGGAPGFRKLNGEKALEYVRLRKIDSDFGRTNRQRKLMKAAYDKFVTCKPAQLLELIDKALPYISTDMSDMELTALVAKLLPMVSKVVIRSYSIPTSGLYEDKTINGMMILYPDRKAIRDKLENEYLPF